MSFDRTRYLAAPVASSAKRQASWNPKTPGGRLFKVLRHKEVATFDGHFWIQEMECIAGMDPTEVGRRKDVIINLGNSSEYADKDFGRMKAFQFMIAGIPEGTEISTDEDSTDAQEFLQLVDNMLAEIVYTRKDPTGALQKKFLKGRGEPQNLAEGSVVGINYRMRKDRDGNEVQSDYLRDFPFVPFLPHGSKICDDDFSKVQLEDGTVVDRVTAVLTEREDRNRG